MRIIAALLVLLVNLYLLVCFYVSSRLLYLFRGQLRSYTNHSQQSLPECTAEEKKQRIQSIQYLYALELFDMKKYSQSLSEFIKLKTDPGDVIKLYRELDGKSNEEKAEVKKIKGKDLDSAINALLVYLTHQKKTILKTSQASGSSPTEGCSGSNSNVKNQLEIIDTTLLKCYLQLTKDGLIVSLLRENNCNFEETEKVLVHHAKHWELVILYEMKGEHRKALQLLKEQSKQPDSPLEGYQSTKKYLQQLGSDHLSLIFEFSNWILKEHPQEGLQIFTADVEIVQKLPRSEILDFLIKDHENVVIPYLEHIIHNWKDTNAAFHDTLINLYIDKIISHKNGNEEDLQDIQSRLLTFLENSTFYSPDKVLLHLPVNNLFEERAIVLGKLGSHEQALAIIVLILGDVDLAVRYSEKVSETSNDIYHDVFVHLMRIVMNPNECASLDGPLAHVPKHPKTTVPDFEIVLHILKKHVHKISPLNAISVLPDSIPLISLKQFLGSSLDGHLTLKRQVQIFNRLSVAEHTYINELKEYHESKCVVIDEDDVCPVCKKRFKNQTAIVRYPNGYIVHYLCKLQKYC